MSKNLWGGTPSYKKISNTIAFKNNIFFLD